MAAFVSGGLVPASLRNTTNNGIVHIADWYATFAKLAGQDPTDHRASAAGLPPIDSIDMWPFLSGAVAESPRKQFPVGDNCVVQGDWKLITSKSSPSFWQGPRFPNASSVAALGFSPPPRPFPRLQRCYNGSNATLAATQWWSQPSATLGAVCSLDTSFSAAGCLNVQGSTHNVILWPRSSTANAQFAVVGTGASSTMRAGEQANKGCIAAQAPDGELMAFEDCSKVPAGSVSRGWRYDETSKQLRVPAPDGSGDLCVAAFQNGTTPPAPPSSGVCASGCLFNVVDDPTEQNNLYAQQPERVANLSTILQAMKAKFFQNHDKFTDDCPAGTKDCACWMAKSRYGGFMGPFAMLNMSTPRPL